LLPRRVDLDGLEIVVEHEFGVVSFDVEPFGLARTSAQFVGANHGVARVLPPIHVGVRRAQPRVGHREFRVRLHGLFEERQRGGFVASIERGQTEAESAERLQ
jgi:hypothetical protein